MGHLAAPARRLPRHRPWGFEYVTGFPWVKLAGDPQRTLWGAWEYTPRYGTGFWVRGCTEPILVCKRGNVTPGDAGNFCGIVSENFHHSRKPENLFEYAEAYPGPYLELFARRTAPAGCRSGATLTGGISATRWPTSSRGASRRRGTDG